MDQELEFPSGGAHAAKIKDYAPGFPLISRCGRARSYGQADQEGQEGRGIVHSQARQGTARCCNAYRYQGFRGVLLRIHVKLPTAGCCADLLRGLDFA